MASPSRALRCASSTRNRGLAYLVEQHAHARPVGPAHDGPFTQGHGVFEGTDTVGGQDVMLRFNWHADLSTPVWEQSFSYDSGATWKVNWTMTLRPAAANATPPSPKGGRVGL